MRYITYLIFPLLISFASYVGSTITRANMDWFATLQLPSWAPAPDIIGVAWSVIFILFAIAMIIVWHKAPKCSHLWWAVLAFVVNLLLNVFWTYLFFELHLIQMAGVDAFFLAISVIALMLLYKHFSKLASLLLLPYVGWVIFATYLTMHIGILN